MDRVNGQTLHDFLRRVEPYQENVLDVTKEVDGDSKLLRVVLAHHEQPPLEPLRAESKARGHMFHTVEGFVAYLGNYGGDETVVLADVERQIITATLDETAERGRESVQLEPVIDPLFEPWTYIISEYELPLAKFATFLMTHRRSVVKPDGRELALLFSQVRASQKKYIYPPQSNQSVNSLMIETWEQGERKWKDVELPDTITLKTPIYIGCEEGEIEVDLTLSVREDTVFVMVTSADLLRRKLTAFTKIVAAIQNEMPGAVVAMGTQFYQGWDYLE